MSLWLVTVSQQQMVFPNINILNELGGCMWVFLRKLMSELVSNASTQHEPPGSRVCWQITPRRKIPDHVPPPLHLQTRQRAPDNHVLDLVVVCTLSSLQMSLLCTALLLHRSYQILLCPPNKSNLHRQKHQYGLCTYISLCNYDWPMIQYTSEAEFHCEENIRCTYGCKLIQQASMLLKQ